MAEVEASAGDLITIAKFRDLISGGIVDHRLPLEFTNSILSSPWGKFFVETALGNSNY